MDKYKLVLDIIEHPDNYTPERLTEILSDHETREIYNLLCKVDSVIETDKYIDIEAAWKDFSEKHAVRPHRSFLWLGSRAASIVSIVGASIIAVAAGIAVTVSVIDRNTEPVIDNELSKLSDVVSMPAETITTHTDTINTGLTPIMFENESLETIMETVASVYGVEAKFNNKDVASLHLYYQLDPALSVDEIVEQLNTFEQININRNGKILTID